VVCPACRLPYPSYKDACQYPGCGEPNPGRPARHSPGSQAAVGPAPDAGKPVPAGNAWNPDLMRCGAGHVFDGRYAEDCPRCSGASMRPGQSASAGFPRGLAGSLAAMLGARRIA
jgi:hypothetical protein